MAWAPDRLLGEAPWREQPSPGQPAGTAAAQSCLVDYAAASPLQVLRWLDSTWRGLDEAEAQARLTRLGDNAIAAGRLPHWGTRVLAAARNPFVVILICLSVVSTATGDLAGAAALRAMVATTATVIRRASAGSPPASREVPVDQLVPGDVVQLVRCP